MRNRPERPRPTVALGLLLALACTGCISSVGPRDAGSWFEARGADFMDVLGVRVAVGPGLGAYARATRYLQFGLMWIGPTERELPAPKETGSRSMPAIFLGTIGRYGGVWKEESHELMLPGWSTRDIGETTIERRVITGWVAPKGEHDDWEYSLGLGAHFLLVGAQVELRPWEIIDFVAGLVGYDPSTDDVPVATSSLAPPEGDESAPGDAGAAAS